MDVPEAVRLLNMTLGQWQAALADPKFRFTAGDIALLRQDIEWMSQAMCVVTDWAP